MTEPTLLETHCGVVPFRPLYAGYRAETAYEGLVFASKTRCTCTTDSTPLYMCTACICIAHARMFLLQQTAELKTQKNVCRVRGQAIVDANSRIKGLRDEVEAITEIAQQRQGRIAELEEALALARSKNKERKLYSSEQKQEIYIYRAKYQQAFLELEAANSVIERLLVRIGADHV